MTTSQDMDEKIVANWNKVVSKGDIVYHLGDFGFFRNKEAVRIMLSRLNGHKHLVVGNHDNDIITKANGWASVSCLKDIRVRYVDRNGIPRIQEITLCHYAMKVWKHSGHGSWQNFGHSHGTLPEDPNSFQMDVGVDANNFTPVSFFQVKDKMSTKYYVPVDYHGYEGASTIPEHGIKNTFNKIKIFGDYKDSQLEDRWDNIFTK